MVFYLFLNQDGPGLISDAVQPDMKYVRLYIIRNMDFGYWGWIVKGGCLYGCLIDVMYGNVRNLYDCVTYIEV